jgi:hypothetical protein
MKTFIPIPVPITSSRAIRQPRAVQYRLALKRSWLRRFQHFIESTDWDQKYLCNKLIDEICLGVIILSILYFVSVLAPVFLK